MPTVYSLNGREDVLPVSLLEHQVGYSGNNTNFIEYPVVTDQCEVVIIDANISSGCPKITYTPSPYFFDNVIIMQQSPVYNKYLSSCLLSPPFTTENETNSCQDLDLFEEILDDTSSGYCTAENSRKGSLDEKNEEQKNEGIVILKHSPSKTQIITLNRKPSSDKKTDLSLVNKLLIDIYGRPFKQTDDVCETNRPVFTNIESDCTSIASTHLDHENYKCSRLIRQSRDEIAKHIDDLRSQISRGGFALIRLLKRRERLKLRQERQCNVITAYLQALSQKTSEDSNMRFSMSPSSGDSGYNQWLDAMKMVARLPGGIPSEFRRRLWITLAERHLANRGVNWAQTERTCFNEWSNPDDSELGIQIVKDLHRTGCSLFCGSAGQENQALLKRVLLAYARWNKTVGYCQGFNMLAALILQVMDCCESDSVKVMIYLIEGVLPESYFANNLRGLSVDMAVFRDLLRLRLPILSRHLDALQNDVREGTSYEPPLTNVFTMQWFLTLFCNCLPQATVLRVWDLIFLEGNEVLLRTALAIWSGLEDRILAVNSADEFYSIMGVLTREMLEFGFMDANTLIKSVVAMQVCNELPDLRDKYLYNITPWTQTVQSAARKGFRLFYSDDDDLESDTDEKMAVTTAYGITALRKRRDSDRRQSTTSTIQPYSYGHPDREKLTLDISALKQQYAKLRERQRQAHIILTAACARQPMGPSSSPAPIAMNHLLLGKSAILSVRGRRLGPPQGAVPPSRKPKLATPSSTSAPISKMLPSSNDDTAETIHWKDTARRDSHRDSDSSSYSDDDDNNNSGRSSRNSFTASSSSTSTELCDEPERTSDLDSEDLLEDKAKIISDNDIKTKRSKFEPSRSIEVLRENQNILDNYFANKSTKSEEKPSVVDPSEGGDNVDDLIHLDENVANVLERSSTSPVNLNTQPSISCSCSNSSIDALVKSDIFDRQSDFSFNVKLSNDSQDETFNAHEMDYSISDNNTSVILSTLTENSENHKSSDENERKKPQKPDKLTLRAIETNTNVCNTCTTPVKRFNYEQFLRDRGFADSDILKIRNSPLNKDKTILDYSSPKAFDLKYLKSILNELREEKSKTEDGEVNDDMDSNFSLEKPNGNQLKFEKQLSLDTGTSGGETKFESGRRHSEMALKIIQENSMILHNILQNQSKSVDVVEEESTSHELAVRSSAPSSPCHSKLIATTLSSSSPTSPTCGESRRTSKLQFIALQLPPLSPGRKRSTSSSSSCSVSSSPDKQIFNPFPVRTFNKPPKDIGLKLGLYKDKTSPNK